MPVASPSALLHEYGCTTPEQLAMAMGFLVQRRHAPPPLNGVTVLSAYEPEQTIVLFEESLQEQARMQGGSLTDLEQWHIAHEFYHGLSEAEGLSPWHLCEADADRWADELMQCCSRSTPYE